MIVCPNCRHANDEDRQVCSACGTSLAPGPTHLRPRTSVAERPPIEIRKPPPPSKWRPVVVVGALVFAVLAAGAYFLFRPDPCRETNFSSAEFGYCLNVPDGWTAEPARFGAATTLDQFAPPKESATVVVEAVDLANDATLDQWASFVRKKDDDAGLTPGRSTDTTVDGVAGQLWDVNVTSDSGIDYRMREVVVVRDAIGWRMTLNDTASGFDVSASTFRQMLDSFRFR